MVFSNLMNLISLDIIKGGIRKLTTEQKKIICIGMILLFFFLFFWIIVYAPEGKKFALTRNRLRQAEAQIARIHSIIKGKDLGRAVIGLKANLDKTTGKLPSQDQEAIYSLSKCAKRLNIEIKGVAPSSKRLLPDKISGYNIEELPVSLSLTCEFKALGEYLNTLTNNNSPVLIRIKQLDIKGKGEGRADLDVTLSILAYLSKEKK